MQHHTANGGASGAVSSGPLDASLEANSPSNTRATVFRRAAAAATFSFILLAALPGAAQEQETTIPEATSTESPAPDSSIAEVTSPDSTTTESSTPDSTTSESTTPESTEPESTVPDSTEPESPTTETTASETTTAPQSPTTAESTTTNAPVTTESPATTAAQSSSSTAQPTDERLAAAESAKEQEVGLATARLSDLEKTLAATESKVSAEVAKADLAKYEYDIAQALVSAAADEVRELQAQVQELQEGLGHQAIQSFKDNDLSSPVLVGQDPTSALRMQTMLAKATQTDIDYANLLDATQEELLGMRREAEMAAADAERLRDDSESTLADLEEERERWRRQAVQAEARIDYLLSEQQALESLGADAAAGLEVDINQALIDRLAAVPVPEPTTTSTSSSTVSEADIVEAANGIMVHRSVVDDVRQLLADAAADGVELRGGGYRNPQRQIEVRKANCGTSNFAIYEMRSSQCSPPTARPGRSMHEQGKAIDFTFNGSIIRYRSGAAWNWLNANASKYGFYNLPSEPWHWSTNGR